MKSEFFQMKNIETINAGSLLRDWLWNDKLFLLWRRVEFVWNTVNLYFDSTDSIIWIDEVMRLRGANWNDWLLSMGVILLFQAGKGDTNIVLIERPDNDAFDAWCLTMPAWRLDDRLSRGCMKELYEEVLFGNEECYYKICPDCGNWNDVIEKAISGSKMPSKNIKNILASEVMFDGAMYVKTYLDWWLVDEVNNVFMFKDIENSTLEFRKILLCPELEITRIADWDWYKRNMYLLSLSGMRNSVMRWYVAKYPDYRLVEIIRSRNIAFTSTLKNIINSDMFF